MKISKFGHACLLLEEGEASILIDPGSYSKGFEDLENLDGVLITHQHADHLVADTLLGLAQKNSGLKVFCDNVGYLVANKFFYPGDNFILPEEPVEILALPIGAPWLKISEVIAYVMQVRPKVAIPVHDAVLAVLPMNVGLVEPVAATAGIEVRVVADGSFTEIV